MAIYRHEILLPRGNKNKMAEELGYSLETIKRACKYITNSETALEIRKAAIEKYSGQLSKIKMED